MNDPVALKLPDETWLEILGQQGLDYRDLKCVARVCRRLNKLEADTSLDSILFRAHPSIIKIKRGSPAIVHPVLEATWLTYLDLRCAIVNNYTTDTEHNVCELRCRKEFATSPATKRLVIDMGPGLKIKKKKGVKVKHVLRAVCEMWEKPVSEELIRRKRFKRKDPFRCEEEEPITWWDLYGERRSWAGWETLEVRKDGEVTLKNREFDWT